MIINDRVDLAMLSLADGVHLGQEELSVEDARQLAPHLLVGVSTHCLEDIKNAELEGADYIGCGPTFPSKTKTFDQFAGLDFLKAAHKSTSLPAFAIGGINADNLTEVRQTGFFRIAISQAFADAEDPLELIRQFRATLTPSDESQQ